MINVPPSEWGYHLWVLFYVAAGNSKFFSTVKDYIPCIECRDHYIATFDLADCSLNNVIEFHKKVCLKLNKPYVAPVYGSQELVHNSLFKYLIALEKSIGSLIHHTEFLEVLADTLQDDYKLKFKSYLPITKNIEEIDIELRLHFVYKPSNFLPLVVEPVRVCCGGRKKL